MYVFGEIKPRIFYLEFGSQYHCNMMFLRYQEYYESPNPKFRGQVFEIFDFMEWYSAEYGHGNFTYLTDWVGFNVPSYVLQQLTSQSLPDHNRYDSEMNKVYQAGLQQYPDGIFYIIGSAANNKNVVNHEIAHGLFYTNESYRKEMTQLVSNLKPKFRDKIYTWLTALGYADSVLIDECQAYLATGFPDYAKIKVKNKDTAFKAVFEKYGI